ncbi:hypothetical protein ACJZ2D_009921 [Fusarium nematophilum]
MRDEIIEAQIRRAREAFNPGHLGCQEAGRVTENTTIPVPKIHACSYEAESPIGYAFIMMDYIQGVPLSALLFRRTQKWGYTPNGRGPALTRVHDQLADVFIQLRGITLRHRPLPVEVALQEVEHLDPTAFFPERTTFKTARDYIRALMKLGHNRLSKTKNLGVDSREAASEVVFAYGEFFTNAGRRWIHKLTKANEGPFVLMHGNMALHGSNLLWDERLNLVAVINWEWCHTAPVSCFIPPAWLNGFFPDPIRQMCLFSISYICEIKSLCRSIADRSQACFPQSPLAQEWDHLPLEPFLAVVLALLYPETIDGIFWEFIIYKLYDPPQFKVADGRLGEFIERPDAKRFIDRKMADQEKYDQALEAHVQEQGELLLDCRCWNCRREKQNFDILQKLPRLSPSPPSSTAAG